MVLHNETIVIHSSNILLSMILHLVNIYIHVVIFPYLVYVVGTLILWVFWPSFNSALSFGNARYRAIINTYYSMTGSVISTFIISAAFNTNRKLSMVILGNSKYSMMAC